MTIKKMDDMVAVIENAIIDIRKSRDLLHKTDIYLVKALTMLATSKYEARSRRTKKAKKRRLNKSWR